MNTTTALAEEHARAATVAREEADRHALPVATVTAVEVVRGVRSLVVTPPCQGEPVRHGGGPTSGPVRLGSRATHEHRGPASPGARRRRGLVCMTCPPSYRLELAPGVITEVPRGVSA